MNIAIIENGHFEVAYTLISLFDTGDNKITIFSDAASYTQLGFLLNNTTSRHTWIIKEKEEPNRQFIGRLFEKINNEQFDFIYFNTIADNFIIYANHISRLKSEKVIMTLHDINGYFTYKPSLSIRKLVRYIGKRKLIKTVPAFNVLSEGLVDYLQPKIAATKKIYNIPGSFFDPDNFIKKKYSNRETIKIVIPGSIDTRRRNYDLVFELLEKAKLNNVDIHITLLGGFRKNHSGEILNQCIAYQQSNKNLHIYHTKNVDQPEFDRVMNDSHFVWMPLRPIAIVTDGAEEKYGISISTGNTGDVIRHAKPFFVNAGIKIDSALQKSSVRYDDISTIIQILQKLTPEEYTSMQKKSFEASLHYTKEVIRKNNPTLFS